MIAIDTSVWVEFFRGGQSHVRDLMLAGQVIHSPTVTGELAMGNLRDRDRTIQDLQLLEPLPLPSDHLVLDFVNDHALYGTGIGWSDAQILASVALHGRCQLLTRDKRLMEQAQRLGCAYLPVN